MLGLVSLTAPPRKMHAPKASDALARLSNSTAIIENIFSNYQRNLGLCLFRPYISPPQSLILV